MLGLERKKDWYNKEFVKANSLINKYEAMFGYLSYLYLKKQISSSEFKMFEYIINRLARNKGFKDYMFNEYHFSKRNGADIKSYYLLEYMKKRKMIDDSFWDNNSGNYVVLQNIRNN